MPEVKRLVTKQMTLTYANADLGETIEVHEQYGVPLLTPEEIRTEMPKYPSPRFYGVNTLCHPLDWAPPRGCRPVVPQPDNSVRPSGRFQRLSSVYRENS